MSKPVVICLTPVKNEAWILERFLKCASVWADVIIVADQASDDGSREIAQRYAKVNLVNNPSPCFNGYEMRRTLIDAARGIPGQRLLVALDADEALTANFLKSLEWETALKAPPGTAISSQLAVLRADLRTCWIPPRDYTWGFMDDCSEYVGTKIHELRVPVPVHAHRIALREIKLMHYVGVDLERWKSKHRWYQCWERLNEPHRRAIDIYRQYHRIDVVPPKEIRPIPKEWLSGYKRQGIDMTSIHREGILRYDKEVLRFLSEYGPARFKREAIWDLDWTALYKKIYSETPQISLSDPRSRLDKYVHRWLRRTQSHYSYFNQKKSLFSRLAVRTIQKMFGLFGW